MNIQNKSDKEIKLLKNQLNQLILKRLVILLKTPKIALSKLTAS